MIGILLAIAWSGFVAWRIYILIRFFQIEEYNTPRFLRWVAAKRTRLLPNRFVLGAVAGFAVAGLLLALGIDVLVLHLIWWLGVGVFIAYPKPVKEIKKRFVRTQRAMRMLLAAFIITALLNVGIAALIAASVEEVEAITLEIVAAIGLLSFLAAPLLLVAGNYAMYPVEAALRRGFREKARRKLQQVPDLKIIGITGSFGKTSTKQYIAHILSGRYKVIATPKSYNTLMGVCLTINNNLDLHYGYQYFVVEMGAYIKGEIKRICQLTRPQISVVSAVGPQHLERFGSLENIREAKYEIVAALPPDGIGVFNGDNDYVREMEERGHPQTRWLVSCAEEPLAEAQLVGLNVRHTREGLEFEVLNRQSNEQQLFRTTLIGRHNVTNILLATAVALQEGMRLKEIAMRVATLSAPEHRLRRNTLPNGVTILDDAYNTNPVGAANALQVLSLYKEGRRILITPGMVELGPLHERENEKLGRLAAKYCTDIVLVGIEQTQPIQHGIKNTTFDTNNHLHVVDTLKEAIDWYQGVVKAGDAVLFLNDLPDIY